MTQFVQKRKDAVGFFWTDLVEVREKVEKIKRTPPERTWESPDYLPGLEEALEFKVDLFTDEELISAQQAGERLVFDTECYPNYWLIAFQSLASGKIIYFELTKDKPLDVAKLEWVMLNFCIIGFNSLDYDAPLTALALAGKSPAQLFNATERIIIQQEFPRNVLRSFKVKKLVLDHIDLIEVAPLRASLKIYSGRLHTKKMQDLPFIVGTILSPEQIAIVRYYCTNDLNSTALLYNELVEQIKLRETMTVEYGVDLRSKSDAQVAEAVIVHEVEMLNWSRPQRPTIEPGTCYKYRVPNFIQYSSATMQWTMDVVRGANFYVSFDGTIGMPPELKDLEIPIAGGIYRMGIGGLHSSETKVAHKADKNTLLLDRDVASYYPSIILNQMLFPQHLGANFLKVYQTLVTRRLKAKHEGLKIIADSLKITINGSFGKLGSPYSVLYSPDLLIQVTITGQLALLMLIERIELAGIPIVSANTDGVVIKCPADRRADLDAVVKGWEKDTAFETEETEYKAIYSRDVNNYIAVKIDGKTKVKGAYAERGSAGNSRLSKNPTGLICADAVLAFLATETPIFKTIRECKDITRFVSVRTVKGGAVKDGVYLGKSIRWYYRAGEEGEIIYASNGNKVPRSEGAKPLMELPNEFPDDINYKWYEAEAEKILQEIGFYQEK